MIISFTADPMIAPITSAHTDFSAKASATIAAIPMICAIRSNSVTRPSIRCRFAVSIRVGLNPDLSSVTPATGSNPIRSGAAYNTAIG